MDVSGLAGLQTWTIYLEAAELDVLWALTDDGLYVWHLHPPIEDRWKRDIGKSGCALAAGVSMKVVQERLGHSSISLIADTYTSVLDSVAASAADQIAAFIDGPTGRSSAR